MAAGCTGRQSEATKGKVTIMGFPPRNTPRADTRLPLVQYANGLVKSDQAGGRIVPGLTGFHIEIGKYGDDFDRAMHEAGTQRIKISHLGGSAPVQHWYLGDTLAFWPLTAGPVSKTIPGCMKGRAYDDTCNAGIGLIWPKFDARGGQGKSKLALQGYIKAGSMLHRVIISVHSTMTDKLLAALVQHYEVLKLADGLLPNRADDPVAFYELALMLRVEDNAKAAGKGSLTTEIYNMACAHPTAPDVEYLRSIWRPKNIVDMAAAHWDECVDWAWQFREQVLETAELAEEAA